MSWASGLDRALLKVSAEEQAQRHLLKMFKPLRMPTNAKAWLKEADKLRQQALERVYLKGFDPKMVAAKPDVVWGETIKPLDGKAPYVIRKLRYEALPGYWVPALLYEPKKLKGKVPGVLNPNGHHRAGKTAMYKQARCANLARRGMIALNYEFIGQHELEHDAIHNHQAHLNISGLAGVGVFYLAMKKGLDVLLSHPNIDKKRVAMTGLSGGGWQTIVLSSLDTRITTVIPVAGYTPMRQRVVRVADRGDLEQMPPDLTTVLDFDTMTAMLAPRPTLQILNNRDDCCFRSDASKKLIYDQMKPLFKLMGAEDKFAFHGNDDPGTHNYDADNRAALYRFLNRHFGLETPEADIHEEAEIYSERELAVGLPASQVSMMDMAREAARAWSDFHEMPRTESQRQQLRKDLRSVIRMPEDKAVVRRVDRRGAVSHETVTIGPWTMPVSSYMVAKAPQATLVLHDYGRSTYAATTAEPKPKDRSVFVADVLGFGEMAVIPSTVMLLEAAGGRALGVAVRQTMAAAELARQRTGVERIDLVTYGNALGVIGLIAAALEPHRYRCVRILGGLQSLTHLAQYQIPYETAPAMFCPDLLTVADLAQIETLLEGVRLEYPERGGKPMVMGEQA
ncbi:MAG: acetylxylan esterase [Phycisphaeraceae bacterium]|nr:acetylxylan esterase [Phycisphaeraceae bacterium]